MTEKWNKPGQHHCWITSPEQGYGIAVDECTESEKGEFWVSNGEYGSQVNFCPICGAKAPTPVAAGKFGSGQPAAAAMIRVWHFSDAPADLKALSSHGGDEDWLAHIPAELNNGHYYGWMEDGSAFGCCSVSLHDLPDGSQVRIGAHA